MSGKVLTNARIKQFCGGKAEHIIQVVSDFIMAYSVQHGTIGREYDRKEREEVRKLLCGEYLGDGSKIWADNVFFLHYNFKSGTLNLGKVNEVK
jgi:hypothetical protein